MCQQCNWEWFGDFEGKWELESEEGRDCGMTAASHSRDQTSDDWSPMKVTNHGERATLCEKMLKEEKSGDGMRGWYEIWWETVGESPRGA